MNSRICYFITFFIYSIFSFTTTSNAQSSSGPTKECASLYEKMPKLPPLDVFDFIQNIKNVIKNELFLQECFFYVNNLMHFTNSNSVEKFTANSNWLIIKKNNMKGISYGMEAIRKDAEKEITGELSIDFYPPLVTADYILEVFGPISMTMDPYEKTDHRHPIPLVRSTHLYGNLRICHFFVDSKISTEVCSLISASGSVSELHILQKREK